jgi:hypothetical protein
VANSKEQIEAIRLAVEGLHHCKAAHSGTMPVHEVFRGETVWKGDVEWFALTGHPRAQKAYGWIEPQRGGHRLFAVLELPPVKSALDAVRASIVADARKGRL